MNKEMKTYIGTKIVKAMPMTMTKAQKMLGRGIKPATVEEDGYLVEYKDGYRSWSPKSVFEEAYKPAETFLDRLSLEQHELTEKVDKLRKFLSVEDAQMKVGSFQFVRMTEQLEAMEKYLNILIRRIDNLKNEGPTCN
ncbi:hypothetical protein [uncultured Prevotella sp.]|jgi:hypothetical protein|uniref:crAss001_48 related protein n=1 Tax=uncultured Prevotella sp. TaxID=159272 RepID=UPI0027E3183B|nr:hypothetical protein [uncultured Prevotella sp.]